LHPIEQRAIRGHGTIDYAVGHDHDIHPKKVALERVSTEPEEVERILRTRVGVTEAGPVQEAPDLRLRLRRGHGAKRNQLIEFVSYSDSSEAK
jgi:hypothetical protein